MNTRYLRAAALAALCALPLAACGSHTDSTTTTTTTDTNSSPNAVATDAMNAASPSPTAGTTNPAAGGAMKDNGAMAPTGSAAPVPASLTCAAGDQIVWVNERRKVYHMASDPYYGRTKHGSYMCESDAKSKGYHMAGSMGATHGGAMNNMSPGAQSTP